MKDGSRILSAYPIDPSKPSKGFGQNTFWIITEADRSARAKEHRDYLSTCSAKSGN